MSLPLTLLVAGVERLGCRVSCQFVLWDASTAAYQRLSSAAAESAGDKREDDLSHIRMGGERPSLNVSVQPVRTKYL